MEDMRERLKLINNKEELSSINISKINEIIQACLRNRRNFTNYQMLYDVSKRMSTEIRIPNRHNEPIQREKNRRD